MAVPRRKPEGPDPRAGLRSRASGFCSPSSGLRRRLLAGGLVAAEMPTPGELLGKPTDSSEPVDMFIEPETGNPVQVYAEQEAGPSLGMIRVQWHYDELHPDGTVRRTDVPMLYTLWTPERLGEALKRAGFS